MLPLLKFIAYVLTLMLAQLLFGGCSSCPVNGQNMPYLNVAKSDKYIVDTFVSGLEVPWSLAFAKDGRLFIAERPGRIRLVEHGQLRAAPIFELDDVFVEGEAGLMGLALHPEFLSNHLLFICYTTKTSDIEVRVKRMRVTADGVRDERVILDGIPGAAFHAGCRLKFGPDKKLYVTTGDKTDRNLSQRLDSLAGKTLRINDDGSAPSDNPFVSTKDARKEIWSYGHRNAQGMDFQPESGLMFQTEHGPSGFDGPLGGDEVNIVERGQNLGWPITHHNKKKDGLVSPLLEYTPAIAPAGATFFRGSNPSWTGNFFFGALRGESLIRVVLKDRQVVSQEKLFETRFGRIRDVAEGPDGALYFSTSNRDGRGSPAADDDRILRLRPDASKTK